MPDNDVESQVVTLDRIALSGANLAFVLMGIVASSYGPLLHTIAQSYQQSLPTAGLTLTVHFVGALSGVLAGIILIRRVNGAYVVAAAMLMLAAGAALIVLSSSWWSFLLGVSIVGLGFGGLDFSVNQLLSRTRAHGRAARLTVVNGSYGIGAVAGPLLIETFGPSHFKDLFVLATASAILLSSSVRGIDAPVLVRSRRVDPSATVEKTPDRSSRLFLWMFVAGNVLYVCIEATSGGWISAQLQGGGYQPAKAALVTAGFWAGITVGRLLAAPASRVVAAPRFVLGGLIAAFVLLLSTAISALAPYAYPLVGLALAAVFPMGLAWYTTRASNRDVSSLLVGAMVGGMLGPSVESLAVSLFGIGVVPFVIAAFTAGTFTVFAIARCTGDAATRSPETS